MAEFPIPEIAATPESQSSRKGQFGVALEPEVVRISIFALGVGLVAGLVAQGLLELIHFFTNLFFYGKISFADTNPAGNHLGLWVILIPSIGALVVGLMIYYLEPTLKGHGIPEAMEAVLFGKSRMRIRVAVLKPLATALAIGTGGPFGAEGPIIQTGAAIGSLFGQAVGLSPYYRRVLLASGAAAGMAATFTAPLAGILVAVERAARAVVYSGGVCGGGGNGGADSFCGMGAVVSDGGLSADEHDGAVVVCGAGAADGRGWGGDDSGAGVAGGFLRRASVQARANLVTGNRGADPRRHWILLSAGAGDEL
jgi:hypothetical protein